MGWERLNRDRLAKVLALTGSDRDGEALAALRKANGMLSTVGLNFGDLARQLDEAVPAGPRAEAARAGPARDPAAERQQAKGEAGARAEIRVLLQQISELHGRLARAEAESAFQQAEARHWHDLTIEAARYVCLLEEELFAVRRALEAADRPAPQARMAAGTVSTEAAPAGAVSTDADERERSAASAGGALGERIAQFVAWQKTLSRA